MRDPRWWAPVRRIVTFLLGCAVIVDALLQSAVSIGELIVGLLMIGVLPIDDLIRIVRRSAGRDDQEGGADDGR
jgi:hypothetical protein